MIANIGPAQLVKLCRSIHPSRARSVVAVQVVLRPAIIHRRLSLVRLTHCRLPRLNAQTGRQKPTPQQTELRIEKCRLNIKPCRSKHAKVVWRQKILIPGMFSKEKSIEDARVEWIRLKADIDSARPQDSANFRDDILEIRQLVKDKTAPDHIAGFVMHRQPKTVAGDKM